MEKIELEASKGSRKRAYSYVRFSRLHQVDGDSMRRQSTDAVKYCADNNLDLQLTGYEDKGVSAFQGRNAKKGGLAKFLAAVESGTIPSGSALVVEALDRISRQSPRRTLGLLTQLLDAGIEIHFTMTKNVISPDSKSEGFDLIMALAQAIQANGESENKSKRLKEAFEAKRVQARQKNGHVSTTLPWWLIWVGERPAKGAVDLRKIICPPDRKRALLQIFQETAAGFSSSKIARKLQAEKVPTWRPGPKPKQGEKPKENKWVATRVRDCVRSRAPEGVLEATPKTVAAGRAHKIEEYYPVIITPELAAEARATLKRNLKSGKHSNPTHPINLLRGIVRSQGHWMRFANHPNGKMIVVNDKEGKPIGKTRAFNWYYEVFDESANEMGFAVSGKQLEGILLAGLSEIQVADLCPPKSAPLVSQAARLSKKRAELRTKVSNLVDALESGSTAVATRLVAVEKELKEIEAELENALAEERVPVDVTPIREMKGLDLEDLEQREQLAAAIHRIITKVDVGGKVGDLPGSISVSKFMLKGTGETFFVDDTTPARRKPVWVLVTFVGGGQRLIIRDQRFSDQIISTRWTAPSKGPEQYTRPPAGLRENLEEKPEPESSGVLKERPKHSYNQIAPTFI